MDIINETEFIEHGCWGCPKSRKNVFARSVATKQSADFSTVLADCFASLATTCTFWTASQAQMGDRK